MSAPPIIAIDGPTASGKGTIAQRVADALGFHYLDSGALYRLVAWRALSDRLTTDDLEPLTRIAASIKPSFSDGRIRVNGQDVTDAIRSEQVSRLASQIAVFEGIRSALLHLQRARRQPPGLVADGRDMGTVVFPDAQLKIYLSASAAARAERRYKQLIEKGFSANMPSLSQEQVKLDIEARDLRDAQRAASPLRPAEDAHHIDSSELSVDEVVGLVLRWYGQSQETAGRQQN